MSDIHALSGAYAVDALDDLERISFERHLAGCPTCSFEVDGLREASAQLAEAVATTPPAELRARVLAHAATTRPLPPVIAALPVRSGVHRRTRRMTALVAAAAAVVAIGAGAVVVDRVSGEQTSGPTPAVELSAVDQVLQAPDAERFTRAATGGGTVTVVRSASLDQAVLQTRDLAPVPDDKTRELWLQHGNEFIPAGYLPAGSDHTLLLDGAPASAKAFGMTIEPASGSRTPSDELVAIVPFKKA